MKHDITAPFHYVANELFAEEVNLSELVAQYGTPCYVYSKAALTESWQAYTKALGSVRHRLCYAVKANSNLAILQFFAKRGLGFDIVSSGELARVLRAGGDPKRIIFSGVAKSSADITYALNQGIGCFNVESVAELTRLQTIAKSLGKVAPVALRINPDIDAKTHPYIATGLNENKFGIPLAEARALGQHIQTQSHLKLIGLACHIGSQLLDLDPICQAVARIVEVAAEFAKVGIPLEHLNVGGGLGVCYDEEIPPAIARYVQAICQGLVGFSGEIFLEPGRSLVAQSGLLLTRVEYLKSTVTKNFAIVDAGMTELIRPALYNAWHKITPLKYSEHGQEKMYDIVGPVCESADVLGSQRQLAIAANDILAVWTSGAYGFCMSSNYNSRPRAIELMVDGDQIHVIRDRERLEDLFAAEHLL